MSDLDIVASLDCHSNAALAEAVFYRALAARGLACIREASWETKARATPIAGTETLLLVRSSYRDSMVLTIDGRPVHLHIEHGTAHVQIGHGLADDADAILRRVEQAAPRSEPAEPHVVPVSFWSSGAREARDRKLRVEPWSEIADNYAAHTRARLRHLMHELTPGHGGQLILWSGSPGTGKTFTPTELLERLVPLVPRPRINLLLYHGVLAPNAPWRRAVVRRENDAHASNPGPANVSPINATTLDGGRPNRMRPRYRSWAELMRRASTPTCSRVRRRRTTGSARDDRGPGRDSPHPHTPRLVARRR